MASRIDEDGLVGSSEHPTVRSSGNPLLDTAVSCIYEVKLNGRNADIGFLKDRESAIAKCQNPDGTFNKNPGRPDQITHDDLMAAAALTRACGMPFARTISAHGRANQWNLSNTGLPYPEAFARPWDIPIYTISASEGADWDRTWYLAMSVLVNAFQADPGNHRVMWVASQGFKGVYNNIDLALLYWSRKMTAKYETVGGMMEAYLPKNSDSWNHPYVVYGRKIKF